MDVVSGTVVLRSVRRYGVTSGPYQVDVVSTPYVARIPPNTGSSGSGSSAPTRVLTTPARPAYADTRGR